MTASSRKKIVKPRRRGLWFERLMAIAIFVNFVLVLFDLSYIPFRDIYLRYLPSFTTWYGETFKGIEPERATETYLDTYQNLRQALEQSGEAGLESPEITSILARLRIQSTNMIDENPFEVANKTGTLERIKQRMREKVDTDSAKDAFATFWSAEYLEETGWLQARDFFSSEIEPLLRTNYYRGIGLNGEPIDRFWLIDVWFFILFGTEFLIRTLYLSLKYRGTNWFDAMLWRWYDVLLLIPIWRWLRFIPLTIRFNQARLVNLLPIQSRIVRGILASVAIELTEIVVIRIIDQMQTLIKRGDVARALLQPDGGRRYVDVNGVDEIQALSQRLVSTLVYQVLPQVKPEFQALISHAVTGAFDESPAYKGLQAIPGIGSIPDRITQSVTSQVLENIYATLKDALEDPVGAKLTEKLASKLVEVFQSELRQEESVAELEYLLTMILEEIKINYVQRLSEEDIEEMAEKTYRLYETTQIANKDMPQAIALRIKAKAESKK
ncbi:MAG: hypothetical protein VKL39_02325 [Leptolyngbyaceae bacterium]|nr:hypothetical protein [Leptolyngbyaceae bacterium]